MSREGFGAHQTGFGVLHITNQPPFLVDSSYPYFFVVAIFTLLYLKVTYFKNNLCGFSAICGIFFLDSTEI